MKTLLITRPDHDITTRYLSAWSKKIIEVAGRKNIQVLDLKRQKASLSELKSRIKKMDPSLVILNGHGSENCVTGYENKILVKAGDNEKLLESRIVYAVSCRSAKELGSKSIKAGALTYIGYTGDFIFCHDTRKIARPLDDKTVRLFLEPSNQVSISLIKGNTTQDSTNRSKQFFWRNIQKLLSSEGTAETNQYAKYLWWNMKHQVCLGDQEVCFE